MQHTRMATQLPPAGAAAEQAAGNEATSSSGIESLGDEEEEEEDAANARLCCRSGGSRTVQGASSSPPAVRATPAGAAPLSLACHIAYHPSYQVPVLYLEVGAQYVGLPLHTPFQLPDMP